MSATSTQSALKVFRNGEYEYIFLYFRLGKSQLRINTKNKVIKNGMTGDNLYKANVPNFEQLNAQTIGQKEMVDAYIRLKLQDHDPTFSSEECQKFMATYTDMKKLPKVKQPTNLFDSINSNMEPKDTVDTYFKRFYAFKIKELPDHDGTKDYGSLQSALLDFQRKEKKTLYLEDINSKDFIVDFKTFLAERHPAKYLTRGNLNDNTIGKRITGLKTFTLYLEDSEIFMFKKNMFNVVTNKYDNEIIALTKEDIKKLLDLDIKNAHWQRIIDIFVCNCFMGLRFSDLFSLCPTDFIEDSDGDIIIHKENKKTGIWVTIPVQKTSLEILKKYKFNMPTRVSQYFNRELKAILEHYDLFGEKVIKVRRVNGINKDFKTIRRKLISTHTCRRTFITLAISHNVPLNVIMLASGHTQLATLKKYAKKVQDKKAFKAIDITPLADEPNDNK